MNLNNPLVRALACVVAIATALRLTWLLLEPVLPALAVALAAFAAWRLVGWYRDDRW